MRTAAGTEAGGMNATQIVRQFMAKPCKKDSPNGMRELARQLCVNYLGLGQTDGLDPLIEEVLELLRHEHKERRLVCDRRTFYVLRAAA